MLAEHWTLSSSHIILTIPDWWTGERSNWVHLKETVFGIIFNLNYPHQLLIIGLVCQLWTLECAWISLYARSSRTITFITFWYNEMKLKQMMSHANPEARYVRVLSFKFTWFEVVNWWSLFLHLELEFWDTYLASCTYFYCLPCFQDATFPPFWRALLTSHELDLVKSAWEFKHLIFKWRRELQKYCN